MNNTIIYLLGFPGTGKYTIAKALCAQALNFKLVDNQLINNPIFSLLRKDGETSYSEEVWNNISKIRNTVLDTMAHISPKQDSFVLTNVLLENDAADHEIYKRVETMAKHRKAKFVPVRLLCDSEERERRIIRPDRAKRFKETQASIVQHQDKTQSIITIEHQNRLTLNVTNLSPEKAAKEILSHTQGC